MTVPFDVTDGIDLGDIDDQEGGDLMPAARNVVLLIKKAAIKQRETQLGEYTMTQLEVEFAIGVQGTDGEGANKNRRFFAFKNLAFPGILLDFNKERYNSEWWNTRAKYQTKMFLKALGYDPKTPPRIDDNFLAEITGKQLMADIVVAKVTEKIEGVYKSTGEVVNHLTNFKPA